MKKFHGVLISERPCPKCGSFERIAGGTHCRECNRVSCKDRADRKRDVTPGAWDKFWSQKYDKERRRYEACLRKQCRSEERRKRGEARARGDKYYASGTVCPKGHIGKRFVSGSDCFACCSEKSASKEKKEYDKARYAEKRDEILERSREYHANNRENRIAAVKAWGEKNPDRVRAIKQNYKYRRRAWEEGGVSTSDLRRWEDSQEKSCYWCGKDCREDYHIDHYYPLSKGGSHELDNMVISCPPCNRRKSAKMPEDFAKEIGKV